MLRATCRHRSVQRPARQVRRHRCSPKLAGEGSHATRSAVPPAAGRRSRRLPCVVPSLRQWDFHVVVQCRFSAGRSLLPVSLAMALVPVNTKLHWQTRVPPFGRITVTAEGRPTSSSAMQAAVAGFVLHRGETGVPERCSVCRRDARSTPIDPHSRPLAVTRSETAAPLQPAAPAPDSWHEAKPVSLWEFRSGCCNIPASQNSMG